MQHKSNEQGLTDLDFLKLWPCGLPEEGGAGARIAAETEKKGGSTWDFGSRFADLHLVILTRFFPTYNPCKGQ